MIIDLSDLPLVLAVRQKAPADPLHPEREWRGILDLLPTWRPDRQAGPVMPLHTTAARMRSRPSPLPAPVTLRAEDDDEALALCGSRTSFAEKGIS